MISSKNLTNLFSYLLLPCLCLTTDLAALCHIPDKVAAIITRSLIQGHNFIVLLSAFEKKMRWQGVSLIIQIIDRLFFKMSEKHYLEWYYLSFSFCLLSNLLCPYAYSIHELLKQLKSDHTKNK